MQSSAAVLPASSSSAQQQAQHSTNGNSEFSPYFLAAAAAASAQADAARAADGLAPTKTPPSSSSPSLASNHASTSDVLPQPPLPYLHDSSPFPVTLSSRIAKESQGKSSRPAHRTALEEDGLGKVRCCEWKEERWRGDSSSWTDHESTLYSLGHPIDINKLLQLHVCGPDVQSSSVIPGRLDDWHELL